MPIKVLIQTKMEDGKDVLSISLLLTEELLKKMLDATEISGDHRAVAGIAAADISFTVEAYRPGQSKNLQYVKNLSREDWSTISVATL